MTATTNASQIFTGKKICSYLLVIAALMTFSCTAVNQARTIGKGKAGLELSFGGPLMTNLGPVLPMPNFFLGGRYGLREDLDLSVNLNLLTPVIPGIALDLITGGHWFPLQPGVGIQSASPDRGWSAGLSLEVQWITDFKNGLVVLPSIDIAGSYRYKWISIFTGCATGFNFYRPGEENILQISPFLGLEFITPKRISFGIKFSAYDLFYNFDGSQVEWIYLKENGAVREKHAPIGIAVGLAYTLPDRKRN
ncbi:MAG: hypothetical protein GX089_07355 [Fibrobacter sp.]|jgi:hypothetical protein|nr:hypothetical protein [Fibrobacter sp.]